MEYTFLGRSGLRVSRFCLGTMNFGFVTDEKESFNIMDTADVYGSVHNPVVTTPILVSQTVEQLRFKIELFDIKLSDNILAKLDELWPGPGGEAPEAYAW